MDVLDKDCMTPEPSCQRETCPDCSSPLVYCGNCGFCPSCGFSRCG